MRTTDDWEIEAAAKKKVPYAGEIKVGQAWKGNWCTQGQLCWVQWVGSQPKRPRIDVAFYYQGKCDFASVPVREFRSDFTLVKDAPPDCSKCEGAGAFLARHYDAPPTECGHCNGTGREPA